MTPTAWFESLLACPDCRGTLQRSAATLECSACRRSIARAAPLDMMPMDPRPATLTFDRFAIADPDGTLSRVDLSEPENSYDGPMPGIGTPMLDTSLRDTALLLSEVRSARPHARRVLDLGCGPRNKFPCFDFLGFEYVGLDLPGSAADVLGDAHFLPFLDAAFDVVFSYAVLEHLNNPFVAFAEVRRVLRPGGIFVGSVALGEPAHSSFFHHTAWALVSLSEACGLTLCRIWPAWDTLQALATMSRYPSVIRVAIRFVGALHERAPFLAPRRRRLPVVRRRLDQIHQAGALCFCMESPNA
jgi:SAM-dependent methyltransferase